LWRYGAAEARGLSGQGGGGRGGDRCVTIAQLKEEIAVQGATPPFWVACRCHVTYLKAGRCTSWLCKLNAVYP
jgi:replication factor A1